MTVPREFDPASLLPDWSRLEFVVLERDTRWSSAVAAEFRAAGNAVLTAERRPGVFADIGFVSVPGSRQIVARLKSSSVLGIIAVLNDVERETLVLLGRLARLSQPVPPVLMLGDRHHRGLVPVLHEAGASAVLIDRPADVQVAEWCHQVVRLTGRNGGRGKAQDV